MDHKAESQSRSRAEKDAAEESIGNANASAGASTQHVEHVDATFVPRPAETDSEGKITFQKHNRERYVWPFELCQSYEVDTSGNLHFSYVDH